MRVSKTQRTRTWRRLNAGLMRPKYAVDEPLPFKPALTGDRVPYGTGDNDGTTILQSDEREAQEMP